jgi:CubicO group peptidase (beta-lactamase class C family)
VSGERALPEQASLRYLKVAAKRRHTAGEFATLHDAQLAVARENGQPSWAALRRAVTAQQTADGRGTHALTQLRWIASRFRDAGQPGWQPPGADELSGHFTAEFLAAVPPERLIATITDVGPALRADLVITSETPFAVYGRLADYLVTASTETRPPFRLTGARARRLGTAITDPRAEAPPVATVGPVPGPVREVASTAVSQLGLAGLAVACATTPGQRGRGREDSAEPWAAAVGWASLERAEPLGTGHAFPAFQVTMAVTAVTVLALAGDGRLRLDETANSYLTGTGTRLADDAATIRELLAHIAGVSDPPQLFTSAGAAPEHAGPEHAVLECTGRRGSFALSHAGYAALGAVIAACTGLTFAEAASQLVLRPLGMNGAAFHPPRPGAPVTGYDLATNGTFRPLPAVTCIFPAAAGLWATAADLARFGRDWATLLPKSVAAQALRPHTSHPSGVQVGLGWIVNESAGLAGLAGDGPGGAASLLVADNGRVACAALASRQIAVEPVNAAVLGLAGIRVDRGRKG